MAWNNRTVLVTGAGGFIGSHLAEQLVALGAQTRALVEYNSTSSWGWLEESPVKEEMEVFLGDIRDPDSLRRCMEGVDVVFHLAALIGIPYSYQAPLSYIRTNVEGTFNVLQQALEADVKRVVHTSTSEVYGTAQYVPIDEKHPLQGQSPYSASKIGADKIAESYHRSFQLPVVTVRPFNTFGPRQSARAVIPTIITQCLAGTAVRLGNLSPTRDLNYVSNTVDGFIRAAEVEAAVGKTFNLGSGREIRIGDLAQLIAQLAEKPIRIEQDEERVRTGTSEVDRLLADNTAAQQVLGWTPAVSLEEGLRKTLDWMKMHLEKYQPGLYAV